MTTTRLLQDIQCGAAEHTWTLYLPSSSYMSSQSLGFEALNATQEPRIVCDVAV